MVLETACVSVRELPLLWVFLWPPSSDTEDLKVGGRRKERKRGEKGRKGCERGEQEKGRRGEGKGGGEGWRRVEKNRRKWKEVREGIGGKRRFGAEERELHTEI